jgi:hypothetical protein
MPCYCDDNDDGFMDVSGLVPRHKDAIGGCPGYGGGGLLLRRRWLAGWARRRVGKARTMPVKIEPRLRSR